MPKKLVVQIVKAETYKIKPKAKYLLIIKRSNPSKGDLAGLNQALETFFGSAKVLAIFTEELTDTKIAEVMEGK